MEIIKKRINKALFVGSFTYFKKGHFNLVKRALKIFDIVYVAPSINVEKNNQNTLQERYQKVKEKLLNVDRVIVLKNELDSDILAKELNAVIIRGIRVNDEKEFLKDSFYEKNLTSYYEDHGVECFIIYNKHDELEYFPNPKRKE